MKKRAVLWLVLVFSLVSFITPAFSEGPPATSITVPAPTPPSAPKQAPDGNRILFDLIFLRPAGIIACGVGVLATVASLPFAIPSKSKPYSSLLEDAGNYTIFRPLGEIEK
jgi:hypothetical protein